MLLYSPSLEPAAVDGHGASGPQPPAGKRASAEQCFDPLSCDPGGRCPVGGRRRRTEVR